MIQVFDLSMTYSFLASKNSTPPNVLNKQDRKCHFNAYPNVYPEPEKGRFSRFRTRNRGRVGKQKELAID